MFRPYAWLNENEETRKKLTAQIENSEFVKEAEKNIPIETKVKYNIEKSILENWQFVIIGIAALVVLIKD